MGTYFRCCHTSKRVLTVLKIIGPGPVSNRFEILEISTIYMTLTKIRPNMECAREGTSFRYTATMATRSNNRSARSIPCHCLLTWCMPYIRLDWTQPVGHRDIIAVWTRGRRTTKVDKGMPSYKLLKTFGSGELK